ncbi:hypothetical protein AB1Y20_016158 [Prymnesium parvum]|uniref:Uncharacterized protein n=1 Tax=Prymnesium parvum TaxID=97485 RepID=A0AB34JZ69_PRYPA
MGDPPREKKRKSRWDIAEEPHAAGCGPSPSLSSTAALEAIRQQAQARLQGLVSAQGVASLPPAVGLIQAPGVKPGVSITHVGGAMVTSHSGARVFYPPALPAAVPPEGGMVVAPGGIGRVFIPPADQCARREPSPPPPEEPVRAAAPRKRRGFRETVDDAPPMDPPPAPQGKGESTLVEMPPPPVQPRSQTMAPPSMPPPLHRASRPPVQGMVQPPYAT